MPLRTKLLWERRHRGAYAIARYSLSDDGSLVILAPKPLEARTYDLEVVFADASVNSIAEFTVETLQKLSTSYRTNVCVGMTGDDFYSFHGNSKLRLFPNKYYLAVDVEMDETGTRAAGVYSDLGGENFTVFLTNIDGTVIWVEDVDYAPCVIATSSGGRAVVAAGDEGTITCQDAGARELWRFRADDMVTALWCSPDAQMVAFGTNSGSIAAIDSFGTRKWEVGFEGSVRLITSSLSSGLTAAVLQTGDASMSVYLVDERGVECGTFPVLETVTGISFSPNGCALALSQRNSVLSVYGITRDKVGDIATPPTDQFDEAIALLSEHKWLDACTLLSELCRNSPQDPRAARYLGVARLQLGQAVVDQANTFVGSGDFNSAISVVKAARLVAPLNTELLEHERSLTIQSSISLAKQAEQLAESDPPLAQRMLRESIQVWDENVEACELLAAILARQIHQADEAASKLLEEDDLEAGLAALHLAQSLAPTEERSAKIRIVSLQQEYNLGLKEYEAGNYDKAKFQFAKVLQLDPDNRKARRYFEFSERFARSEDLQNDPLSDRFKMLE